MRQLPTSKLSFRATLQPIPSNRFQPATCATQSPHRYTDKYTQKISNNENSNQTVELRLACTPDRVARNAAQRTNSSVEEEEEKQTEGWGRGQESWRVEVQIVSKPACKAPPSAWRIDTRQKRFAKSHLCTYGYAHEKSRTWTRKMWCTFECVCVRTALNNVYSVPHVFLCVWLCVDVCLWRACVECVVSWPLDKSYRTGMHVGHVVVVPLFCSKCMLMFANTIVRNSEEGGVQPRNGAQWLDRKTV